MKRFNLRIWAQVCAFTFCAMLLISSVGPFADHSSLGHRVSSSLFVSVVGGAIAAWQANKPSHPRRVLSLDDATTSGVDELLAANKRVQAVKFVREMTGADLQTAVDTVEARAEAIRTHATI